MARVAKERVLITGAAAGIGLCTARAFAMEGAELVLTDIDAEALDRAVQELADSGAKVYGERVDVSQRAEVEALARKVNDEIGPVDILINNAGIGHHAELVETSLETWERLISVNLWGVLHHVYAFLPYMKERGKGHIVNVSSGQAFFRLPTWGAYAAIKAAVGAFSEILHFEVKKHGIKVTTVYPYMVNTGFYQEVETQGLGSRMSMKLLPYYSQTPEKVARIIVKAVKRGRRVEMVHVFNDLGYYMQLVPPAKNLVSRISNRFMTT